MSSINTRYLKNIGIVSFGPLFAAVLGFFAEPWISRYWGPKVYGIGIYYNSIINIVSGLMFLRYNFAIVQAKTQRQAHSLLVLCIIVMLMMLAVVAPFYRYLTGFLQDDFPFDKYGVLLFITAIFAALGILFRFWYSSKRKFIAISGSLILSSLSTTILLIVMGAMGKVSEANMLYIRAFSTMLVPVILIIPYLRRDLCITLRCVSLKNIIAVAKEFRRYPIFEYWGFAANLLAISLPVMIIARYWGKEVTGLYGKAYNFLSMINLFIGSSVNSVLHKEAADIVNRGEDLSQLLIQTSYGLIKFSILPTVFLVLVAPEFFSVLLGERWRLSGVFAQYLSVWTFMTILSTAILPVFGVLNKQWQLSVFTVSTLLIRTALLVWMGKKGASIVLATSAFALANFVILGIKSGYILKVGGVNLGRMFAILGRFLLQLLPYIIMMVAVKALLDLSSVKILLIASIGAMPYLYLFYIRKSTILALINGYIKGRLNTWGEAGN